MIENIKKRFDEFDLDGSGEIEYDEFQLIICKLLKVSNMDEIPPDRLHQLWRMVDADGSGSVDVEEFIVWYGQYFYQDPSQGAAGTHRSPIEIFYSLLGSDRLASTTSARESRQSSKDDEPRSPAASSSQDQASRASRSRSITPELARSRSMSFD